MFVMSTRVLLWFSTLSCVTLQVRGTGEGGPNSPVFNLDHTTLEKNLAAIFNKVSHGSATTKRSVPVYEAQMSASTTLSTVPAPLTTTPTSPSIRYPIPRATMAPPYREIPSYAPPARAFFTPPLPPEYLNPFADKPTLRGTNTDTHSGVRRPVPPPSLTPAHERIPIRPPDLVQGASQSPEKPPASRNKPLNTPSKEQQKGLEVVGDTDRKNNSSSEVVPTLHYPSISRILSGSNGRKQDVPEILFRPVSTKVPPLHNLPPHSTTEGPSTTSTQRTITKIFNPVTHPTIFNLPNTRRQEEDNGDHNLKDENGDAHGIRTENIEIVDAERLPYPQPQPPAPSKRPSGNNHVINQVDSHPLASTWNIAWSLHVYVAAIMFTLMALYSIYKIVRFNEATNLLSQSYFLTVHLLLTTICTLRCFHLFYDAYNLAGSLPEPLSRVLMYLPAPLLTTAFATLVLYLARCSQAPSLNNKFISPTALVLCSAVHVVLCISLHVSTHVLDYNDDAKILPLVCQCVYIIVCVTLGLCYMYVYRVARSQIQITNTKSVGNHVGADPTTVALSTAITTTIATAMLSILMGFVQLYGIFGVQGRIGPPGYPWLWWGWQFSVRLLELSICGLLAWVGSLSQYPLREKQLQQHSAHSGFALFPCGSSTSTENMDDVLYPAICSTNQAIQNYTNRTGKQVYDDSFPLNTLPEHLNISGTFERHSIRKSGTMGHFPHEARSSLNRHGNGVQTLRASSDSRGRHTPIQNLHDQPPTSGSTMLVAEDGFVRFRSLGAEEDDLSDSHSIVGTHGRGSSLAGSVRYNARHPGIQHQHQHSHSSHQGHHQSHHQLYNNT
ncbi:proline-rich transmembrane protein 4 [Athalia rosae]|uniref:proline-rich transmembrane protein 4 n=1 Tax=Athalia rosae TaxID=37344 RepID=UPI0006259476|nr:proline-rich transmembrane protein 4 [Athalia rosae]XP_012267592.1 proline-rich transmembrane protein 4 [Athalia rosae]